MKPSEIRARVMEDHAGLRVDLDRLEALARRVREGDPAKPDVDALRSGAKALLDRLWAHMRWEETWLLPALRGADAWGSERARRLVGDHREQRVLLEFLLDRLLDSARPDRLVFSDVDALLAFLRKDMEEEERDLVDERILRDDVVGIEVETG
jgi:iron-sulfur cluster repair protein YtfE (RIC family)